MNNEIIDCYSTEVQLYLSGCSNFFTIQSNYELWCSVQTFYNRVDGQLLMLTPTPIPINSIPKLAQSTHVLPIIHHTISSVLTTFLVVLDSTAVLLENVKYKYMYVYSEGVINALML